MKNYYPQAVQDYIEKHREMGFDELAYRIGVDLKFTMTKQEVKTYWNYREFGLNHTPRTLISVTKLGKGKWQLEDELIVYIAPLMPIVIPAGFVTDFASVPRLLWWLISPTDDTLAIPAIIHDLLYRTQWLTRRMSDEVMNMLMMHRKASPVARFFVYRALRLAGWVAWNRVDPIRRAEVRRSAVDALREYYSSAEISAVKTIL